MKEDDTFIMEEDDTFSMEEDDAFIMEEDHTFIMEEDDGTDISMEEYDCFREGTPSDFVSSYMTPSSLASPQRPRDDSETKTYMPPLYVLSPAEIQRACEAFFTIPSWNNLIIQVMEECAAATAASSLSRLPTTTPIPAV
jgi:hypothetical protein